MLARFSKLRTAVIIAALAVLKLVGQSLVPALAEEAKPQPTAQLSSQPSSDPMWAASFKDLTGTPQALSAYKGKVALVYFWATWCEPCQKEGPAFQALFEKFKDKNFVVVGIAVDNADKVRAFVKDKGMAFPNVYAGTEAIKLSKDMVEVCPLCLCLSLLVCPCPVPVYPGLSLSVCPCN